MSVTMIATRWKMRYKDRDPKHVRLWTRMNKNERFKHILVCDMCLTSAVKAVESARDQIVKVMTGYTHNGTVTGRLHSNDPKPWRTTGFYAGVGQYADTQARRDSGLS